MYRKRSGVDRKVALVLVIMMLASAGCVGGLTRQDTIILSGETLKASDKQYDRVRAGFVDGCKAEPRQIPESECSAFRDFGQKWHKTFPLAVDLWLIAKDASDKATLDGAGKVITGLLADLSKFALRLLALASGGK